MDLPDDLDSAEVVCHLHVSPACFTQVLWGWVLFGEVTAVLVTMFDVWLPVLEGAATPCCFLTNLYAEDALSVRELS